MVWRELRPNIPEHVIVELKIGLKLIDTYVVGDVLEVRLFQATMTDERHHLSTKFMQHTWVRSYAPDELDKAIEVFNRVRGAFAAAALMDTEIDVRAILDGKVVGEEDDE